MSMVYCENCDKQIDTDFDAEHFEQHESLIFCFEEHHENT